MNIIQPFFDGDMDVLVRIFLFRKKVDILKTSPCWKG